MKRFLSLAVAALVAAGAAYATLQGDAKEAKKEKEKELVFDAPLVCPVMGTKIAGKDKANANFVVNGVRYFTCCGGCNDPLKKEPAKFTKNFPVLLTKNKVKSMAVNVCPMAKKEVKGEAKNTAEVGMFKVAFCCGNCSADFAKLSQEEKEKKVQAVLPKKLTEVKFCPQMSAPVSDTSAAEFTIVGEYKVYFCCPGCKPEFEKLSNEEQLKKAAEFAKKSS